MFSFIERQRRATVFCTFLITSDYVSNMKHILRSFANFIKMIRLKFVTTVTKQGSVISWELRKFFNVRTISNVRTLLNWNDINKNYPFEPNKDVTVNINMIFWKIWMKIAIIKEWFYRNKKQHYCNKYCPWQYKSDIKSNT